MFKFFKKTTVEQEKNLSLPPKDELLYAYGSSIYKEKSFIRYNPSDLVIKRGNTIYKNMMKDEQVRACLSLKRSSVLSRGFTFVVESDDEIQHRIADFFWSMVSNIQGSFGDKINGILSGIYNGFSVCEKVSDTFQWDNKTYWGIKDIKLKPFDTFAFETDPFGTIKSVRQMTGMNETVVPMERIIHWVYQPDVDNCYGESDLRSCFRAWWSKDTIIKFYNIFLERHASGFPIVKRTEGAAGDSQIKQKFLDILDNLSIRTNMYVPQGYDVQMIQPQRTDAYEMAIVAHDKAIAKALLLPNLLGLSEQSTGSYAQSQTQFTVFLDLVIESLCNSVADCLNEQMFRDLALINFGTEDFPKFQFTPMTKSAKIELVKVWAELVSKSAVVNGEKDENFIRELIGFPDIEKREEPTNKKPAETPEESLDKDPDDGEPEDVIPREGDLEMDDKGTRHFAGSSSWVKRVDFTAIKNSMDKNEQEFADNLTDLMGRVSYSLMKQIAKIIGDRSMGNIKMKEFENIGIPKKILTDIRKITRAHLITTVDEAGNQASKELPKQKFQQVIGMDKAQIESFLASKSLRIAGVLGKNTIDAIQQVIENGIKADKTLLQIMQDFKENTTLSKYLPLITGEGDVIKIGKRPSALETIVRTNISDSVNQARRSVFGPIQESGFITGYEFSAVLDNRVSDICERLHGRRMVDWGIYIPPLHPNCRSVLVPITVIDEWDPRKESDSVPKNVQEQVKRNGFG